MDALRFTFPEVLSLFGVFQCVYVIVHISFRARRFVNILLPVLYFFVLGAGFFLDASDRFLAPLSPYYNDFQWFAWTFGTPLSVLLIIQISQTSRLPSFSNWLILTLVPVAYLFSRTVGRFMNSDCMVDTSCVEVQDILNISGSVVGALSLLMIWINRTVFSDILKQRAGKERYWLILSLIIVNIAFLALGAFGSGAGIYLGDISLLRTVLGLSFVYLVSTSLLRIYPSAFLLSYNRDPAENSLRGEDMEVARKIESLLQLEKIYHEPTYSRSDLARELGVPDGTVSRIINIHFNKSFPQLLNERRIEDAKRLLLDTDVSIKVLAEEVGFNSLPSFNRVFKDISGQSPSAYRKHMIK